MNNYQELKEKDFSFVYITTKSCNVCKVLKPKLIKLSEKYPKATFNLLELDDHPDAAGFFMAFSIPTFLVYSENSELIRTARHINFDEIELKLDRYYNMIF